MTMERKQFNLQQEMKLRKHLKKPSQIWYFTLIKLPKKRCLLQYWSWVFSPKDNLLNLKHLFFYFWVKVQEDEMSVRGLLLVNCNQQDKTIHRRFHERYFRKFKNILVIDNHSFWISEWVLRWKFTASLSKRRDFVPIPNAPTFIQKIA